SLQLPLKFVTENGMNPTKSSLTAACRTAGGRHSVSMDFPHRERQSSGLMRCRVWRHWCCLAFFLTAFFPAPGFALTEISNVRHWTAPDQTRIVFDLSEEPVYRFEVQQDRIILEFSDASFSPSLPPEKIIRKPGVAKILFIRGEDRQCTVHVYLKDHLRAEVFPLKKFMDKPDRVVVDVFLTEAEKAPSVPKRKAVSAPKRVIVVDPGHGGEDPGAVGKNGTYEKHVVLAISREIKKEIDKMPGYRAVLTRDGDYYVSFSKRLGVARRHQASLFISVHADAARNREAQGSSVYCLSTGAASNEAAKLLARNENLSDIIGGVPGGESNNESDEIILNMFQTNTINLSKTYAADLLDQIGRVQSLKYPTFHEAPFRVLKLPDTPAVLLETAYLSNPQEEKLLKRQSFRKKIAGAVASSVDRYFAGSEAVQQVPAEDVKENREKTTLKKTVGAAEGGAKTAGAGGRMKTALYTVQRGESLHRIAQRHGTDTKTLLILNKMKIKDPLYAGRKILVPAGEEKAGKRRLKPYTVKKGDTLFTLAKSSSVTIEELRRINKMRDTDVLCVGRKIKLPE
ncbi:MAG TPA: N-acetylmuramoyl-L-alanine amidase, partial [Smithellaceae bacterium]|nr:N-acetylmuramoyl-L-alanine amidase [Smithellaceae bacterium]